MLETHGVDGSPDRDREAGRRQLVGRLVLYVGAFFVAITFVFVLIHLGPANPAEETAPQPEMQETLDERKDEFGLNDPLRTQYRRYIVDMFTFDFGKSWTGRHESIEEDQSEVRVATLLFERSPQTAWLWFATGAVIITFVTLLSLIQSRLEKRSESRRAVLRVLATAPVFVVSLLLYHVLVSSNLLFGVAWTSVLVETEAVTTPTIIDGVATGTSFARSVKKGLPPAVSLGVPFGALLYLLLRRNLTTLESLPHLKGAKARGIARGRLLRKHLGPYVTDAFLYSSREFVLLMIGGTIVVERVFGIEGLGSLFVTTVSRRDYTTFQALLFLMFLGVFGVGVVREVLTYARSGNLNRTAIAFRTIQAGRARRSNGVRNDHRANSSTTLEPLRRTTANPDRESMLASRAVRIWLLVGLLLLTLEIGAVLETLQAATFSGVEYPSLLDRAVIRNNGYLGVDDSWNGTFLGLSPAFAWSFRVVLVYAYSLCWVLWLAYGYLLYAHHTKFKTVYLSLGKIAEHYDTVFVIGFLYVVFTAALFAPALSPVPPEHAHTPGSVDGSIQYQANDEIRYYDEERGEVATTTVSIANSGAASLGVRNVGVLSYDDFGRFHPLGTTTSGSDLLTELLFGGRLYLLAGAITLAVSTFATFVSALSTTYLSRFGEMGVNAITEVVSIFPLLPMLFLLVSVADGSYVSTSVDVVLLLGGIVGLLSWAKFWGSDRRHRGRVRQGIVRRAEITGRRSPGLPTVIRALVVPSLSFGIMATIASIVTLSSLVYIGWNVVNALPYEWTRLIISGEQYLTTSSWHVSLIPMASLVLLTVGLYGVWEWVTSSDRSRARVERCSIEELLGRGGGG